MIEAPLQHLIETYAVHKETPVDAVHGVIRYTRVI